MTTPYDPVVAYPPGTEPPPGQPASTDDLMIAAIVAALLVGWSLSKLRTALLQAGGTSEQAVDFLLSQPGVRDMARQSGLPNTDRPITLQRRQNAFRKASYLLNAGRRLTIAWMLGTQPDWTGHPTHSPGSGLPWTGPGDGLTGKQRMAVVWEREKNHLAAHLYAQSNRNRAALGVARAWRRQGGVGLLGWKARLDRKTTADCREADGRNFDPARIPPMGYPGAVHPHCRCVPVKPYNTSLRVEDLYNSGEPTRTVAATRWGWSVRIITT